MSDSGRRKKGPCGLGPDWKSFCITQVLVLIPIVLFFVFVAPDVGSTVSWAPVIVLAVLSLITFTALITTGFRNPGIIPPCEPASVPDLRTAVYIINGHEVITKYCTTCHLYRPPRCSHCAQCDNCVEKFDHHCPWVGTCIGRRNYQAFLTFIFCATLSCLLFIALSVVRLADLASNDGSALRTALRTEWAAAVVALFCAAGGLFVGALSAFHAYLLVTNQTTYEYFRGRGSDNSFHRNCFKNCAETVCGQTRLYKHYPNSSHPTLMSPRAAEQNTRAGALHRPAARGSTLHRPPADSFTERNGDSTSYHNVLHDNGAAFARGALTPPTPHARDDDAMLPPVPSDIEMTALRQENARWETQQPVYKPARRSNGDRQLHSPIQRDERVQPGARPPPAYHRDAPPAQLMQHEPMQSQSPLRQPPPQHAEGAPRIGSPPQGLPPPQHGDVHGCSVRSQQHYSGSAPFQEQRDPAVRAYAQVARSGHEDAPQQRRNGASAVDRVPRRGPFR